MPVCYMMVGVPGSGKSTAIKELLKSMPHLKVASSDSYIDDYAKSQGKTYNDVYKDCIDNAVKHLNAQVQDFIKNKEDFIWDQTNIVKSSRMKKLKNLISNKYEVFAITFELSSEELERRLNKRVQEGGKTISPKLSATMLKDYERPDYEEGFSSIILIQDDGVAKELSKEKKLKVSV